MDKRPPFGGRYCQRLERPTTGESVEPAESRGPPCGRGLLAECHRYTLNLSVETSNRFYRYSPQTTSHGNFLRAHSSRFPPLPTPVPGILRHPGQPRGTDPPERVDTQRKRRRSSLLITAVSSTATCLETTYVYRRFWRKNSRLRAHPPATTSV